MGMGMIRFRISFDLRHRVIKSDILDGGRGSGVAVISDFLQFWILGRLSWNGIYLFMLRG